MKLTFILLAFCFISLIAVQANSTVMDTYIKNFPLSVKKAWAQRDGRYKHYLWHQVREGWNRFSDTTKEAFRKIGWEPPNPARTYDSTGRSSIVLDNKSGEEFLYMHQMMINKTNEIIKKNRESMGNVTGWTSFPAPGDPDWPVPGNYTITGDSATTSSTNNRKTDSFYRNNILPNEKLFKDYTQLRKMSLAELGARIEVTVHGYAHMRWSNVSELGYRNSYRGTIPNIDPKWDDIRYDWLGESYSAHVNPIFWKIHGWVNDRIEDWRKANNLRYIKWNGTWTGGPMGNIVLQTGVTNSQFSFRGTNALAGVTRGGETITVNAMDEALKILKASNVPEAKFIDNVSVPKWTRK